MFEPFFLTLLSYRNGLNTSACQNEWKGKRETRCSKYLCLFDDILSKALYHLMLRIHTLVSLSWF